MEHKAGLPTARLSAAQKNDDGALLPATKLFSPFSKLRQGQPFAPCVSAARAHMNRLGTPQHVECESACVANGDLLWAGFGQVGVAPTEGFVAPWLGLAAISGISCVILQLQYQKHAVDCLFTPHAQNATAMGD